MDKAVVTTSWDDGHPLDLKLAELLKKYDIPATLYMPMDNPEREWLEKEGCKTIYIEPGSPWENAYVESFIGKFRDECLNMELFRNVREAQEIADAWKEEYNKRSPHSSLGNLTPKEFAEVHSAATALPSASPYLQNVREANPVIPVGT
jgi:putative transposase